MSELPERSDNPEIVHEESDVNVSAIFRYGTGLAVIALAAHLFLWWLFGVYERQQNGRQTQAFPIVAGQENRRRALRPPASPSGRRRGPSAVDRLHRPRKPRTGVQPRR